ncbi:tRNA (adenosine(37)-N6)-threonylcarbamoyltransferase complex dimerization subunit type 1 TsaB [Magnetospira thiophila]
MENPDLTPTLLALDTATSGCAVALCRGGAVLARRAEVMPRGQSEALLPMVRDAMAEAGLRFDQVDRLAVTIGPGAFTGLRIGLAAARGLALAMDRPLVPITTTEALAHAVPQSERTGRTVLVVLDSKRADFYAQLFDADLTPLGEVQAIAPQDLATFVPEGPLLLVGDATDKAFDILGSAGGDVTRSATAPVPDPVVIARLAATRAPVAHPSPLYLRPPDAKLPQHGGRLRP